MFVNSFSVGKTCNFLRFVIIFGCCFFFVVCSFCCCCCSCWTCSKMDNRKQHVLNRKPFVDQFIHGQLQYTSEPRIKCIFRLNWIYLCFGSCFKCIGSSFNYFNAQYGLYIFTFSLILSFFLPLSLFLIQFPIRQGKKDEHTFSLRLCVCIYICVKSSKTVWELTNIFAKINRHILSS